MTATVELGERAWEVEWCSSLGEPNEFGEHEHDSFGYSRRYFTTRELAAEYARRVYPSTIGKLGYVEITPVEWTDPYGEGFVSTFRWETCGDSEYYEGE